ncbi:hypothetical protein CBS101457_005089 [Exobasidium rhododendri]|nr:hypothetical protein CBS101457_005089 [Exobasidium rhododendri]
MTLDTSPLNLLVLSGFGAPFSQTVKHLDEIAAKNVKSFPHLNRFLDGVGKVTEEENVRLSVHSTRSCFKESMLPKEVQSRNGPKPLLALAGLERRFPQDSQAKAVESSAIPGLPVMVAVGVAHATVQIGTLIWHYEKRVAEQTCMEGGTLLEQLGIWAVTGFCGGWASAFSAAASTSIEDLVEFGLGAVRVGFWSGAAGETARQVGLTARQSTMSKKATTPEKINLKGWGCVVGDLPSDQTQQEVDSFNERYSMVEPKWASDLFISAKLEPACVMITGTPDQLDLFVEEQQQKTGLDGRRITRLHIPGPFHSVEFHKDTLPAAIEAVRGENGAVIPSADQLVSPLLHTIGGSLISRGADVKGGFDSATEMLKVCLQERVDWPVVAASIAAQLRSSPQHSARRSLQVSSIGPNSGAAKQLMGMLKTELQDEMSVTFVDINEALVEAKQ